MSSVSASLAGLTCALVAHIILLSILDQRVEDGFLGGQSLQCVQQNLIDTRPPS